MTAEVKYLLDLDDVLAIQLKCSACQVSSSFPVTKLSHVPYECPHCHADWVLPQTAEEKAITTFLSGLRGATEALKGRPFKLSLEVNYEEGEAPI
jgi:hypothetical protein